MSKKSKSVAEKWVTINAAKGYEVSNTGRVRNAETKKEIVPYRNSTVVLSGGKGKKPVCRTVTRLVAEAFIGKVKKGTRVHRIDLSKPASVDNLRIGASTESAE